MPYLPTKQNTISFSFTILYFTPNIYGTAPLLPPCHPERSGTPDVRANATTEQRRAVEPRLPGGAPAGGISVVPAHPRNAPAPPPAFEPSEAKGKTLRHHPKPGLESPLGRGSKNPKASPQRAPETQYVSPTYHHTGALCGEVLGVLRTFSERRF